MRSSRLVSTTKNSYRHKVNRRRYNSRSTLGCTQCVSMLDIENINEVLRAHKSQRAEGKGAWKVVPKDSCEVYKERRKRQAENNHRNDDETNMRTTDSSTTDNITDSSRSRRIQRRNDKRGKKEAVGKTRRRRKPKRRRQTDSSVSSFATTTTSCMSLSEMDYDGDD